MKISVFGTGYVGLVTGTCFAEMGHEVVCADIDSAKIEQLKKGGCPIYEANLPELILRNVKEGRLSFTQDLSAAVDHAEIQFIAVGTPPDHKGRADLSAVMKVAQTIANQMTTPKLVINKSTVPVGTAQKVSELIGSALRKRGLGDLEFDVVSNPEFLREGSAVDDCLKPSRVVIGCKTERARALMKRIYEPFLRNGNPLIVMDPASSELTKYAANAMLATKISLMNEFSRLCEKVGADVEAVRSGIGTDPRIGFHFIYAGLGYGGSCFPKDVSALIQTADESEEDFMILKAVEKTNQLQRERFIDRIFARFGKSLSGKKFGIWGIAFKPGTDDIREAPALRMIERLLEAGATVLAFDPVAKERAQEYFGKKYPASRLSFVEAPLQVVEGSDALCIATEWKQFREPNLEKIKATMKTPVIFDGRNLYSPTELRKLGFEYFSIGR